MLNLIAVFTQVSVGTLLAFIMAAISVLIIRYVPPDEVPLPSSLQESIDTVSSRYNSGSSHEIEALRRAFNFYLARPTNQSHILLFPNKQLVSSMSLLNSC